MITIMTAVMEPMKEKTVITNIRHVPLQNLPARISNVFVSNTDVMEKMIVEIDLTRLIAVSENY